MLAAPSVLSGLREIGPVSRSKDEIAAGVSWRDLYALRDRGEILELSRGLYQLAGAAGISHVDFVAVCGRAPRGIDRERTVADRDSSKSRAAFRLVRSLGG